MNIPEAHVSYKVEDPSTMIVSLNANEWGHLEDHDAVLLQLGIVIGYLHHELADERTLDRARMLIRRHLTHMLGLGTIYIIKSDWHYTLHDDLRRELRR